MNLLISIFLGIAMFIISICIWKRYDVFSFNLLKETKYKWFILIYFLVTLCAIILVGLKDYQWVVLCKIQFVYFLISQVALIDYKYHIIPNKILLGMIILRLIFLLVEYLYNSEQFIWMLFGCIVGAVVGFGILALTNIFIKNGIGMGDAKLFGVIGLFIGINGVYNTLFYSLAVLIIYSIVMMIRKQLTKKSQIPFAPFIFVGYLITFCMGGF